MNNIKNFFKKTNKELLIIAVILLFYFFINILNSYSKNSVKIIKKQSNIRPSYGDEFYNYYGGEILEKEKKIKDNVNEIIIEGFTFTNDEEAIRETHVTCPVMEGNNSQLTNCIQYPNNEMDGLPGPVDGGFLVSVCCNNCISIIQTSLNNDDGVYDIIFRNNYYILMKNNEEKQVVFPCTEENRRIINNIREELR